MTVQQQIALINAEYQTKSKNNFYPFISKNKITILSQGLYKKKNASYRGLGIIKDPITNKDKTILMGYYNVPYNMVIIPENFTLKGKDIDVLEFYKKINYKIEDKGFPKLEMIEFKENSLEHELSIKLKEEYKTKMKKYDLSNNI